MTTNEYLDAIKTAYNLPSDYKLAQVLGISKQSVSRYRKNIDFLGDEVALKVAEMLDYDPAEVLTNIYAERTKCPAVRKVWEQAAKRLATAACLCFVMVFSGLPGTADASDSKQLKQTSNIYYAQLDLEFRAG